MPLKLGAATYTYLWQASLEDAIRRLREIGFRYVEAMATPPHLWPRDTDARRREHLRRLCESLDVELVALNPTFLDLNLASTNPGIRAETVKQLEETIDLAADVGARLIVVACGQRHPLISPGPRELWRIVADGLERCLERCDRRGVSLGLENAWTVVDRAQQLVQLVRDHAHPRLQIAYDVANAAMVQSPSDGLRLVAGRLLHVHLSATNRRVWAHDPIGHGVIDFAEIAAILRDIGYEGVSILEVTHPQDSDAALRESAEALEALGWAR